jgi:formylglycine-generating enzyme required for sulfatase activity
MKFKFKTMIAATVALAAMLATMAHGRQAANAGTNELVGAGSSGTDVSTNGGPVVPKMPGRHFTNSIGMQLLKVPGNYWAGKFEVTQNDYQKVMGSNPSAFPGNDHPVESVSWNDAMEFCRKLTAKDLAEKKLPDGFSYTLPTESQWESFAADASLADAVTSQDGSRNSTAAVGSLGANGLGLFDARGNVMEFCLGDASLPYRVLRGGCWQDRIEINLRTVFRNYCPPGERKNTYGFRCVLLPPAQ